MRIEWEVSAPLERWLPKSSPIRGLLGGDSALLDAGTFAFSTEIPTLPPPRTVAPPVARRIQAFHREIGAPSASLGRAALLEQGAQAVVTGQQAGLMGGPLLTFLKALTALRLAGELTRSRGRPFVPVFWAEAEDHDVAEINRVTTLGGDHRPRSFELPLPAGYREGPAGSLPLGEGAVETVNGFFEASGETEFTGDLRSQILSDLEGSERLSLWFIRLMLRFLGDRGLVVLESSDRTLKELARPFWVRVLDDPLALTEMVRETGASLAAEGYRPVLHKEKRRCAFFLIEEGRRLPVFFERGSFRAGERRYTSLELRCRLDERPGDFSPSVHLRPLLQDYLLPTAAYVGGPTEMAYFLQVLPGYRWGELPAPALVMRPSLTFVEPSVHRLLERQKIEPYDLAPGIDGILNAVIRRENRLADPSRWERLREGARRPLERFGSALSPSEEEIGRLLEKTSGRIDFLLRELEKRSVASLRRRSDTLREQLARARSRLFPGGLLQERILSPFYFMNKYGPDLFEGLEDNLPTDYTRHSFGTIIP